MQTAVDLIRIAAILAAAMVLGNWFLAEVKKARANRAPWYAPYFSLPGITIILIAIALPLALWYWHR